MNDGNTERTNSLQGHALLIIKAKLGDIASARKIFSLIADYFDGLKPKSTLLEDYFIAAVYEMESQPSKDPALFFNLAYKDKGNPGRSIGECIDITLAVQDIMVRKKLKALKAVVQLALTGQFSILKTDEPLSEREINRIYKKYSKILLDCQKNQSIQKTMRVLTTGNLTGLLDGAHITWSEEGSKEAARRVLSLIADAFQSGSEVSELLRTYFVNKTREMEKFPDVAPSTVWYWTGKQGSHRKSGLQNYAIGWSVQYFMHTKNIQPPEAAKLVASSGEYMSLKTGKPLSAKTIENIYYEIEADLEEIDRTEREYREESSVQ